MTNPETPSNDDGQGRTPNRSEGVKPGAILRAMGAESKAITPPEFMQVTRQGRGSAVASAPRIEVVRDGDRVTRILARCRCGETITIECDYATGAPANHQSAQGQSKA